MFRCVLQWSLFILIAASGCRHGGGGGSRLLWTHSLPASMPPYRFADNGFSAGRVLLHRDDDTVMLDGATGQVLWRTERWVLNPPGLVSPLFAVIVDGEHITSVAPIDVDSGREGPVVRLRAGVPLRRGDAQLFAAGGRVLYRAGAQLGALSPTSGDELWRVDARFEDAVAHPFVVADRVVFRESLVAFALADGRELWRHDDARCPNAYCPMGVTGNGRVYAHGPDAAVVEVAADGSLTSLGRGMVAAVSDRYLVVVDGPRLVVSAHGDRKPVLTLDAGPGGYFSAVAATGPYVFYFDGRDATLYRHDVAADRRVAVTRSHSKTVVGTEGVASAGPYIQAPPVYAPPLLFVLDWNVSAYRVD